MKAMQIIRPRAFMQVETPMPSLARQGAGYLLVQAQWASMCGSDVAFFAGGKRHQTYPLPAGAPIHECVGRVVESTSDRFRPSDLVVAMPESSRGLAEFFVARADRAVRVPVDTGATEASCLIQPISTVISALDRLGPIEGNSVGVIGLGSMGLLFCWLLKKRGAERILGVDPCPERCQFARGLGASDVYPMRSIEVVHAKRQDPGFWNPPAICVEAVGHQTDTLNDCLELVLQQGTVLAFGVPDTPVYALEYEIFFRKNLQLLAAVTPDWGRYLPKALELFQSYHAELGPFVTRSLPVREVESAFALYASHEGGIVKAILNMGAW
jgi:L-iditol 2-dehydrogenase